MKNWSRKNWMILGVGFFVGVIVGVGGMTMTRRTRPAAIVIEAARPSPTPFTTNPTPALVEIFINGAVQQPDLYTLPANDNVKAAITAAGGFADNAAQDAVNLAQPLIDGMQIYVPTLDEPNLMISVMITPDAVSAETSFTSDDVNLSDLININSADIDQLSQLPGIGPSTAQKIVDHRDDNGPFATIEELLNVSGIGEGKFEKIEPFITIDG